VLESPPVHGGKCAGIAPPTWWGINNGNNAKWDTLIKVAKSVDIKVTVNAEVIPIHL